METFTKEERKRFDNFITKKDNCILWTGYLDKDGYGTFYFRKKSRRAHRVAYYFKHGDIPNGMVIDHTCKNRNCVNPDHLRAVTNYENTMMNSLSAGAINSVKTTCKNGHPFDRKYGKQRYCSVCEAEKSKRLRKKWLIEANKIGC